MVSETCPVCGEKLSPQNLCPKCLLQAGMAGSGSLSDVHTNPKRDYPTVTTAPSASCGPVKSEDYQLASLTIGARVRYFGDYEILEEIARGGMGVVYRARQHELKRTVALKVILAGQLASETDVARFEREAQAAARLKHPNIVAVHEVGEQDGLHYFSMDFVDGRSLSDLCREESLPARRAAELIRTVAHAIQYAHDRGTLHRDIKPANILIEESSGPVITDFGLAKLIEIDDNAEPDLTLSGQILGTPSYMSPEQASGKHNVVGPGTDIYSLGAVLYACLTGRAPFVAESTVDTIRQVVDNDPASPRSLNPAIPRDLDTICLKCLAKEPHRRYGTANLLAEDLQRFLDGRPVVARPIGNTARAWRWCRRNPVVSVLSLSIVALLLIGTIISSWQAIRLSTANRLLAMQVHETELQREKAQENYKRALRAVDSYLHRVANDPRLEEGMLPLRKQLLDDARQYYEQFLRDQPDDSKLNEASIHAIFQLAELNSAMGNRDEALAQYDRVANLIKANERDGELSPVENRSLATSFRNAALIRIEQDQFEKAEALYHAAIERLREVVESNHSDHDALFELAQTHDGMGILKTRMYQPAVAKEWTCKAIESLQSLVELRPDSAEYQSQLGATLNSLATAHVMANDQERSIASLKDAVLHQTAAVEQDPTNTTYIEYLANHHENLGKLYRKMGDLAASKQQHELASKGYTRLVQHHPSVARWQYTLARNCIERAELVSGDENGDLTALRLLEQAESILQHQVEVDPTWNSARSHLARTRNSLGWNLMNRGKYPEALEKYRFAVEATRQLIASDSINEKTHRENLARSLYRMGTVLTQLERYDDANLSYKQCEAEYEHLLARDEQIASYREKFALCLNDHGLLSVEMGELDRAKALYNRAESVFRDLADEFPKTTNPAVWLGGVLCNHGHMELRRKNQEAAFGFYDRSADVLVHVLKRDPQNHAAARFLHNALSAKVESMLDKKAYDEAVAAAESAFARSATAYRQSFRLMKARALAKLGRHIDAAEVIENLMGTVNFDAAAKLNLAEVYAQCAAAAEDRALAKRYEQKAIHWLSRCLESGTYDVTSMEDNEDLEPIKKSGEYLELINQQE